MLHRLTLPLLLLALIPTFHSAAWAQTLYDESLDGELSDDGLQPTELSFLPGMNRVRGTTNFDPLDPDFFSFSVPDGFLLSAVILDDYVTDRPGSFLAVQAGPQVTSIDTGLDLLGAIVFGRADGTMVGDDLLDDLGMAPWAGSGFTPPLGTGTYSFWYQETSVDTAYAFDFQITQVPEPDCWWTLAIAAASIGWGAGRRK